MIKNIGKRKTIQFSYMVETEDDEVIFDVCAEKLPSGLIDFQVTLHDFCWETIYSVHQFVVGVYKTKDLEERACNYFKQQSEVLLNKYYEVLEEKCNQGGK